MMEAAGPPSGHVSSARSGAHDQMAHDAYTCRKYPNSKPFPTKRPDNYQHVGQVFDARDRSRQRDINGYMRGRKVPRQCRAREEWWYG